MTKRWRTSIKNIPVNVLYTLLSYPFHKAGQKASMEGSGVPSGFLACREILSLE